MHKRILPFTFATCLALSPAAAAQNLNKSQEARAAVGQCYAACMDKAQTTALALYERIDRLSDLLIADEYHKLTEASQRNLVRLEEDAICALAQDHVRALDGCHAGCVDVEIAYGAARSSARSRFRHIFIAARDELRDVGLWDNYQNSATSGAAFDAGCDRYWEDGQAAAMAGASRVAALPALTRHRDAKPVRAEDPRRQSAPAADH